MMHLKLAKPTLARVFLPNYKKHVMIQWLWSHGAQTIGPFKIMASCPTWSHYHGQENRQRFHINKHNKKTSQNKLISFQNKNNKKGLPMAAVVSTPEIADTFAQVI